MINDLIGNAPSSKGNSKGNQNQNARQGSGGNMTRGGAQAAKKPANQRTGEAKTGELSKENTTILADKRINGLVVMTMKELVPTVEQIIEAMDIKLSQVLIETCIIEVTLGDDLKTGIDWVRLGNKEQTGEQIGTAKSYLKDETGRQLYWTDDTREETTYESKDDEGNSLTKAFEYVPIYNTARGLWNGDGGTQYMLGGGGGDSASLLNTMLSVGTNSVTSLSPTGAGVNWFLKSDKFNLGAIIQAAKTDSRAKYIASPIVMTVDNKEATIEATTARKFLSGYQTSSSYYGSKPAPQYENKDIGIKIKVTPKINPNGTVMLEIEEEYSQIGAKQSILDPDSNSVSIDTAMTRKMSADALLENNQTVVLCGLNETQTTESESGIPILKDIPYIGKWLFGSVSQTESRSELLIFMTPYVLADGADAEAEALRRKQALSDPNAWQDHGWSMSKLADPVQAKEKLRRLKLEWKNLDSDHGAELELEKARRNRVLEIEERDLNDRKQQDESDKEYEERKAKIEKLKAEYEAQEAAKKAAEAAAAPTTETEAK